MMQPLRATACLLVVLIAVTGCAKQNTVVDDDNLIDGADWPYWPTQIRVHPLSRLVIDPATDMTMIEARIELRDMDGFTCRGCGQLRIDLAPFVPEGGAPPLASWTPEFLILDNLKFNRERYDRVTQTYLFRLELNTGVELPRDAELRAYYLRGDGATLRPHTLRLTTTTPE